MNISSEYKRQFGWRDWPTVLEALPPLQGRTVLDLGCGVGDLAAQIVARGARVIGVDMNEDLLHEARSRKLPNADFRMGDLRSLADLGIEADGLWSSFMAAYLPDLPTVLRSWTEHLKPGGWIALTEIDDLFGHGPLSADTRTLLRAYAEDGLSAGRYDFRMGRKLRDYLERSGFRVTQELVLADQEFSFRGPASPEVVDAWRLRFQRMKLLRAFCGPKIDRVQEEFLSCLQRSDHDSQATVHCCIARRGE